MDIFTRFKTAIKIREVLLDNEVFQLHYRVTAVLLLACAGLVASKQHFGDPIDCITRDDVPNKIMDTYCWVHSTFTLPDACNKTVGLQVAHPCVDKYDHQKEERVYHKYYQWVYFVLFFQACGFYAPHLIWKSWESKLLRKLTVDLDLKAPLSDSGGQQQRIQLVVTYLTRNRNRHHNYFRYFASCEALNFVNVIAQIYMVDEFLGGTFTTYGLDVLDYVQQDQDDRIDPMVKVFPRMTKCTFHRFGSSGDVMRYDALCILPLNIINEKIYIVMWFWFVFLAFVTGLWLVYRMLTVIRSDVRLRVISRRASLTNKKKLAYTVNELDSGDWFLLSMMCKNMDSQWFRLLIERLSKAIEKIKEEEAKKTRNSNGRRPNHSYLGPSSGKERIIESNSDDPEDLDDDDDGDEMGAKPLKDVTVKS